ncbi:MAG TPA: lactate utilization protein [Pyrinomonadaceae bacterium]|nr:lactate utilization protein [Pyrinomonadaceae bacterium]
METRSTDSVSGLNSVHESILTSIRKSLAASAPFDAVHKKHHSENIAADGPINRQTIPRATLIDNFRKNLEAVGGHCTIVSSETEAAEAVRSILQKSTARRVAVSDSPLVKSVVGENNEGEIVVNAPVEYLFESDMGITGAQWAIAETGTLVLESNAERHRLTSLVPPVHICVLKAETIRQTLGEVLELVHDNLSRTVTFITGASRTSDIELTLAIGVHGPGELHVIVIDY